MKFSAIVLSTIFTFLVFLSCTKDDSCTDCGGGLQDGYVYKTVTQDDIAELSTLGVKLDECIQFKVDFDEDLDLETVSVVDDCCCDLYEL